MEESIMAGKRAKRSEKNIQNNIQNNTEATMTQGTKQKIIDAILQIDTIWTQEDLQDLPKAKLDKILATEKSRAEAKAENIILKATAAKSKGRKKNETQQFTRTARTVQRFLEYTESTHHLIMTRILENPGISGKEINEKYDIKYGQTCIHHARVLLNVLYNNRMLSQHVINKLENIMAKKES